MMRNHSVLFKLVAILCGELIVGMSCVTTRSLTMSSTSSSMSGPNDTIIPPHEIQILDWIQNIYSNLNDPSASVTTTVLQLVIKIAEILQASPGTTSWATLLDIYEVLRAIEKRELINSNNSTPNKDLKLIDGVLRNILSESHVSQAKSQEVESFKERVMINLETDVDMMAMRPHKPWLFIFFELYRLFSNKRDPKYTSFTRQTINRVLETLNERNQLMDGKEVITYGCQHLMEFLGKTRAQRDLDNDFLQSIDNIATKTKQTYPTAIGDDVSMANTSLSLIKTGISVNESSYALSIGALVSALDRLVSLPRSILQSFLYEKDIDSVIKELLIVIKLEKPNNTFLFQRETATQLQTLSDALNEQLLDIELLLVSKAIVESKVKVLTDSDPTLYLTWERRNKATSILKAAELHWPLDDASKTDSEILLAKNQLYSLLGDGNPKTEDQIKPQYDKLIRLASNSGKQFKNYVQLIKEIEGVFGFPADITEEMHQIHQQFHQSPELSVMREKTLNIGQFKSYPNQLTYKQHFKSLINISTAFTASASSHHGMTEHNEMKQKLYIDNFLVTHRMILFDINYRRAVGSLRSTEKLVKLDKVAYLVRLVRDKGPSARRGIALAYARELRGDDELVHAVDGIFDFNLVKSFIEAVADIEPKTTIENWPWSELEALVNVIDLLWIQKLKTAHSVNNTTLVAKIVEKWKTLVEDVRFYFDILMCEKAAILSFQKRFVIAKNLMITDKMFHQSIPNMPNSSDIVAEFMKLMPL